MSEQPDGSVEDEFGIKKLSSWKERYNDIRNQLSRFKDEYDPKHKSDCKCCGCRRFKRCMSGGA